MVDIKKEQERDELHRAIWAIADELRGAVDGWDFKNYVLGTMFYRYISENLCSYINSGEHAAGNTNFDYAKISDAEAEEAREGLVEEKGFFILPSELFSNVRGRAANDENLNETLERVFLNIEESAKGSEAENDFAGLFDDFDVNSNKLGSTVAKRNEKLAKFLNGVGEMNLGDVKNHSIDAFGDAYEYLMTMYASNAGKSGGEFFTPADVSELLTRLGIVGKTEMTFHNPQSQMVAAKEAMEKNIPDAIKDIAKVTPQLNPVFVPVVDKYEILMLASLVTHTEKRIHKFEAVLGAMKTDYQALFDSFPIKSFILAPGGFSSEVQYIEHHGVSRLTDMSSDISQISMAIQKSKYDGTDEKFKEWVVRFKGEDTEEGPSE